MKKFHWKSIGLSAFLIMICLMVMGMLLGSIYGQAMENAQYNNSVAKLQVAADRLEDYQIEANENAEIYDSFSSGRVNILSYYLDQNPEETDLEWFVSECNVQEYYLVDENGNVKNSHGEAFRNHEEEMKKLASSHEPVLIGTQKYYASPLKNGSVLIVGRDYVKEMDVIQSLTSPASSLNTIVVGETGYIADVDLDTDKILYSKNTSIIGTDAAEHGLDTNIYKDGYSGQATLTGVRSYIVTKQVGNHLLLAIVPYAEIQSNYMDTILISLGFVCIVLVLLAIYAEMIRHEIARNKKNPDDYIQFGKKLYLNKNILSRIKNVGIMGLIVIFGLTFYIDTLMPLSHQSVRSETKIVAVGQILDSNSERISDLRNQYTTEYTERAHNIAYLIAKDPSLMTTSSMQELAKRGGLKTIYVFDAEGNSIVTNREFLRYSLSKNEEDQSYPFWDVIYGAKDVLAQDAMINDSGEYSQYIGVARRDGYGMVQIELESNILEERLDSTNLSNVLSHIAVVNDGFLFSVNAEDGTFDYWPQTKLIGRKASDYGLSEKAHSDAYEGFQTLNGTEYMVSGALHENDYVYTAIPLSSIYRSRMSGTLWTTFISAIMIVVMSLMLVVSTHPVEAETDEDKKAKDKAFFHQNTGDGRRRLVQSATSRFETHISWDARTPEQKLEAIIGWVIMAFAVCIVVYISVAGSGDHSVVGYIMNQKWEKGLNLFSLTFVVFMMLEIIVVAWIIRKVIIVIMKRFGARSETVGHLLDSFIKYFAVLGGVFYCLGVIGVDATSLLASASLLGLMVSLGAQSLVSDILAGIFIVFEGEFRVGDIITVGDWRGTVVEIGIRTTKIMSGGHDIKIYNNSEIKQVINMTKQYSTAVIDVGIDYNESLERVEAILKKELPHIREHVPTIIEGPFYKGVTSLGESSVNIRILAECHEKDRIQVIRDMNREMKICFDRNHISIPFPQIVVNEPAPVVEATNEEKATANKFLHEQKEESSVISETQDN